MIEETGFFVTALEEEDGFSPLKLKSNLREEDGLNSIEDDADSE